MKIRLITIGKTKLDYAKIGLDLYLKRLSFYHDITIINIDDQKATEKKLLEATSNSYLISLDIDGKNLSSVQLANFLKDKEMNQKQITLIIGGPFGLPKAILEKSDFKWSLSNLTFPHDMAMLIVSESLFRASTINLNLPYHKF